jgi:uncharacterized protein involved in exopolysaccharide biosynthesis
MARNAPGTEYEFDYDDDERGQRAGPQPKDWAVLLLRAAFRRKLLFLAVLLAGCGAVTFYYSLKRPQYRVEAKLLVARQMGLPSSVRGASDDPPTRTAWELIHRRENLIALIRAANLIEPTGVARARTPLAPDAEDPLDEMVKVLDRKLVVTAEEGTISISLDWPDPQQAYRVVDSALQNFIEARHVQEVTAIDEVISVLRARSVKAQENVERVTDDARREATDTGRDAQASSGTSRAVRAPSEELVRLKTLLDGKKRAIEDVEEFRRRRLTDLHAQLDERRNTYSDAHPSVIQLKQDIDAASKESSQVAALREEEAKLRKDYQARLAQEGISESTSAPGGTAPPAVRAPRMRASSTPVEEDERVRDARFQYQQIVERVNSAQLELDAVRAAFKYRYSVVWPPQMPRDPVSPNPVKIFGAGILAALAMAVLAAAAPDLWSGRITERWQVERNLGLPVIAEIERR